MKRKKNLLFCLFLIVFLCAAAFGAGYLIRQNRQEQAYEKLSEEVKKPEPKLEPVQESMPEPESTTSSEPEKPEIPIDFAKLQKENSDIYAWIRIPDTEVDYPVLQSEEDDTYYLNHTVNKDSGLPGSIYSEAYNRRDFSDPNTVLYGHKMKNGTMFGGLYHYTDPEYMASHSEIYLYTTEHIFTYRVYAAVTYDDRHLLKSFDFSTEEGFQTYLDSISATRNMNSYFDSEVPVSTEDRILTLSTCTGVEGQRFLVEAVLVNEE